MLIFVLTNILLGEEHNESSNLKVHEWISKYTDNGEMDIVTGYFTVGALALISRQINDRIKKSVLSLVILLILTP